MSGLAGKVALVTGGCSGLGKATAARLRASGAQVSVWDNTPALDAYHRQLDVTDWLQVQLAAAEIEHRFGRIDILLNCAGIVGPVAPLLDYPLDAWDQVLRVNLTGSFLCCRAVGAVMVRNGYGRIVNVASIAGKEGNPNQSAYSASKAGIIALTKSLSKELAAKGILVNAISPGLFDTPMVQEAAARAPETFQAIIGKIPLARLGAAEEFAALACWLASEECSYSTGHCFDLSGGRATY